MKVNYISANLNNNAMADVYIIQGGQIKWIALIGTWIVWMLDI